MSCGKSGGKSCVVYHHVCVSSFWKVVKCDPSLSRFPLLTLPLWASGSLCAGGVHPEHDPNPGPVSHTAQLPGRGLLPARQPLHRPLLLRQPLQTRSPRTELPGRQGHRQGERKTHTHIHKHTLTYTDTQTHTHTHKHPII